MKVPVAAVVLCAGKGTRMKSKKVKVLHRLLGRPLSWYPLERAFSVGASPVVAVVGREADDVQKTLKGFFPKEKLLFATQKEQRGTADAVKSAEAALKGFNGVVLILYGDTPLLTDATLDALLKAYAAEKAPLAVVSTVLENPHGYGRIIRQKGKVVGVVEEKDASPQEREIREVNAGVYAVDAKFLWQALKNVKSGNAQGELYLTDLVALAAKKGTVAAVHADYAETLGVNDRIDLAACGQVLRDRVAIRHMHAGVTLVDPWTTWMDEGVVIGADTEIGPRVTLKGATRIGSGVTIEEGCVLQDAVVADGVHLKPYCVLEQCKVGKDGRIGPFARLRPDSELADGVHIGNFVETKNTRIGKGSKANHLSYLGDAVIGAGVNVGAGTITCNYDGVNKFRTVLEDGVFIGSDTQLVAPVTVGAGAYVGAGTTVTQDVPAGALALSRSPQVIKPGWVAKKKAGKAAVRKAKG